MAVETTPLIHQSQHTQIDPIDMIDQQIQTESLLQLWNLSKDDNLLTYDDDDDRLRDYIDEISSLPSDDLSNRLNRECQQILSKQNFEKESYPQLDLNHLALITIYSLYHQHLTDDAKQLYNETLIRALKQEYELINNEKTDYMERYITEINATEKKYHQLKNEYDDLLEQNELERLDSKQSLMKLTEKYEHQLYSIHQENEQLKYNLNNLQENYQKVQGEDYQGLKQEYEQLRRDYDELINENELLKDYNSQMYQRKLNDGPEDSKLFHDIDIQCNLLEENQTSSSWSNGWDEDNTNTDLPIQEQRSKEDEINQLKVLIAEMQLENKNLKEALSQNINSGMYSLIFKDSYH